MVRFIIVTFAVLGWAFYEMSGGADFEPRTARVIDVQTTPLPATTANAPAPEVTRVSLDLTSVSEIAKPEPAVLRREDFERKPAGNDGNWETLTVLPSLIPNAEPEPKTETIELASLEVEKIIEPTDMRTVSGNRVNVRGGPGTNFGIVGKLVRGDSVEVLEDTGAGWVRFRTVDGSTSGWLADFLLSES